MNVTDRIKAVVAAMKGSRDADQKTIADLRASIADAQSRALRAESQVAQLTDQLNTFSDIGDPVALEAAVSDAEQYAAALATADAASNTTGSSTAGSTTTDTSSTTNSGTSSGASTTGTTPPTA